MKLAYAGSFDPFTNGHLHIVDKAIGLNGVEKVVILVSNNPEKKNQHFSAYERVRLIRESLLQKYGGEDHYDVLVLPPNVYAVSFAKEIGCDAMLRGVRTEPDFQEECGLYHANKIIERGMESIYMMPNINLSAVRSSTVMALVGPQGWTFPVGELVPRPVLNAISKKYCLKVCGLSEDELYRDWSKYDLSPYHNWTHIAYCLSEFIRLCGSENRNALCGILMHDLLPLENILNELTLHLWFNGSDKLVQNGAEGYMCIKATDHNSLPKMDDQSALSCLMRTVHDIDLSVLAWREDRYEQYTKQVYDEYVCFEKVPYDKFRKGRSEFLFTMLGRKIFLTNNYDECAAKKNLERELASIVDD